MPPAVATVLYPATATSTFDEDYYLKKHMPLVQEKWGPLGLTSWSIIKLDPSSGYAIQALLYWDDISSIENAVKGADAQGIMDDIAVFSSEKPLIVSGAEIGKQ